MLPNGFRLLNQKHWTIQPNLTGLIRTVHCHSACVDLRSERQTDSFRPVRFKKTFVWLSPAVYRSPLIVFFWRYNCGKRQAMTELEQTIMNEISTLPETRLPDVLAFIRYLKLSIPKEQKEIEERFDEALKSIRARAKEMNITDEDIEAEIRAVREEK
jgi:hypothetical protein